MNATVKESKMLFDLPKGKYHTVALALEWLAVLLRQEENKGMNQSEMVKIAIDDVISGRVTEEEIHKKAAEKPGQTEERKAVAPGGHPAEKE